MADRIARYEEIEAQINKEAKAMSKKEAIAYLEGFWMQYKIKFGKQFKKSMKKLKKKNYPLFKQIKKKLIEIIQHPEHYKPLKNDLAGYRRVHFGSFVLTYTIRGHIVKIILIEHHDKAYWSNNWP